MKERRRPLRAKVNILKALSRGMNGILRSQIITIRILGTIIPVLWYAVYRQLF